MTGTRDPAAVSRRTQADRSATTRVALADATIDVLIEHGCAAVTAIEVCNRAGLTRGAFHHHYAGLPALLLTPCAASTRPWASTARPRPPT